MIFFFLVSFLLHILFRENINITPTLQLLDLKDRLDSKEAVYGALDAWVAWEQKFPIVSLKRALLALEKEEEWHKVVQVGVILFLIAWCVDADLFLNRRTG